MANHLKDFEVINMKHLARKSRVDYTKLRNCVKGHYDSWTEQEKTQLYNAMREEVEKAALVLGFSYEGRPLVKKS